MALGEVLDYGLEQRVHPAFDAEASTWGMRRSESWLS